MYTTWPARIVCALFLLVCFSYSPTLASDPVTTFIVQTDSIANAAGDEALANYITANTDLIGAAVGQLVDIAIQIGDEGQTDAANENFDFAHRLAVIHKDQTGSEKPLQLVSTYRGWDGSARQTRQKAKALEEQATEKRNAGDIEGAIAVYNEAMALYETIDDRRSIAILWGTLGIAYWYAGDFEGVMRQYDNALAARRAIEDRIYEGKTLNGLGSVNYQLGNFDAALDYYKQAIDLRTRTGDIGGLATSMTYLGNVYLSTGRMVAARNAFEQALPVVEQTGKTDKLFELHTSVGGLNAEMGRLEASNIAYGRALELAQTLDDPVRQVICHNNLALNYADAYRYGEALTELNASRALLEQHPDPERSVAYHRNSGIVHMKTGNVETARDEFVTLLQLSEEHQMPRFQLEALVNLGYLLQQLGAFEQGLTYVGRAKTLADEMENPMLARESMILEAQLQQHLGRYDDAINTWELILQQDQTENIGTNIAADRLGLASTLAAADKTEEAQNLFAEVRPVVEESQDGDLILALNFGVGHSFENTNPDSASFYYEKALAIIDETREQISGGGMKTGYLGGVRRFYFEEVARYYADCAGLNDDEEGELWSARSFETIERAKARGLLDLVEASVLGHHTGAEEALLDSLHALDPEASDFAEREREIKELYARTRKERLESSFGESFATSVIVGPEDIRKILPKRTTLLAYALGDTTSLLWVIDRDGFEIHQLPNRSELNPAISRMRDAIVQPGVADEALRQSARGLYEALVAAAAPRIEKAENLIIIPDGTLFEIPFEALLTAEAAAGADWNELPYLARSHRITYVPSASIYMTLHNTKKTKKFDKDLFAMGDPDYSLLELLPGQTGPLEQLPYAREEVSTISSPLKEKKKAVYLGHDANEATFKQSFNTESARVVHLATHGLVDPLEPTASSIALCPDPNGTEDGYLHTLEIMSTPMHTRLVVVSACESARGRIGRGEGVVGLSRAFLASGTDGIVASLWAVSDESTSILMGEFYERMLRKKRPAGRALNEARLALLEDVRYAHPFYWSPFVVIGLESSPW